MILTALSPQDGAVGPRSLVVVGHGRTLAVASPTSLALPQYLILHTALLSDNPVACKVRLWSVSLLQPGWEQCMWAWLGICCPLRLDVTCLHELLTGHEQEFVLSLSWAPGSLT